MKYHSTVGRGDFMKMLGLGVVRTGATAAGPVFHDLDEVIASPMAEWKRPWWVRWVDKPTVEVDWDRMQRFDGRKMQQVSWPKYIGEHVARRFGQLRENRKKQWILEERPGYTLRDRALELAAAQGGSVATSFLGSWKELKEYWKDKKQFYELSSHERSKLLKDAWAGRILSPEELGVPRWEGSPEENARMVRAAVRYFGAEQVGFVELDERTRKLVYAFDALDGKALEFENVDLAYETENKRVIPERARWVIVFSVQMSEELIKRTNGRVPTVLSASATSQAYARARNTIDRLQTFLHVLGYQGLMGTWYNGLGIAPAFGVMAGLGELSRLNRIISPEYGPMQRIFKVVTDLPLAPTKPIDAGIMRFCRTCKRCAEACPVRVLSMETEPSWEVVGPWNNPGHRAYFDNAVKCRTYWPVNTVDCARCLAVCPFSHKDKSFIHKVVATTVSASPLLNGFFTRMHTAFGYETPREPESWWDLHMPPFSINATKGTHLE